MNNDKSSNSDLALIFVASIFILFILVEKYGLAVQLSIARHRFIVAAIVSAGLIAIWTGIKRRLLAIWDTKAPKGDLFKRQGLDSIYVGRTLKDKPVFVPLASRRMHAQVVGTTNAGKTESVIVPWAVADIRERRGLILIDGKSDRALLDKLYAYCVKYNRTKDFRLLSLVNIDTSSTFNPLIGGTPEEITERVFSSFTFEDEYYRNQQYEVLKHTLMLFEAGKIAPTFQRLIQVISTPGLLLEIAKTSTNDVLNQWVARFETLNKDEREKRTSGLVTQLGHFATGETSALFNDEKPGLDIEEAMREGLIVYCQLPVMKTPVLGKATGKMILQSIQSAVSSRHLEAEKDFKFFSVYLDDFTEYLTPGFVSLLNKSRSGNIGVTFAHQAQGDLAGLGDDVRNTIMTNSNLKVFMRTNEPETAEYFSRSLGTREAVRTTERQTSGAFGKAKTGDGSVRDVEEFVHHPNLFKRDLGTGEAVMIVPFSKGNQSVRLKFEMLPNLPARRLPVVHKTTSKLPKFAKHGDAAGTGRESSIAKSGDPASDAVRPTAEQKITQALDGVPCAR